MARLWTGDVDGAASLFDRAAAAGGEEASEARSLAKWLREGAPQRIGIVRLAWWSLPNDVEVYLDRQKVMPGVLFVRATAGPHTLTLTHHVPGSVAESAFFDSTFTVTPHQAYVVQFGAAETK